MEKLFTLRQVQDQLQVDRMTIYRMLKSGRLNGVKVGGQWRFREGDVRHLVAPAADTSDALPAGQTMLPVPCLQAMQQLFSAAAEVAAIAVDREGKPLTEFTNGCAFCDLILASDTGRQRCTKSWAALTRGPDSAPHLHRCHAGLVYARAIIRVDGMPVGAVIAGQALSNSDPAEMDPEQLVELARVCAVPLLRLQDACATIHRLNRAQRDKTLQLLGILGVAASRIGSERQRLAAKLDRIAQITMET